MEDIPNFDFDQTLIPNSWSYENMVLESVPDPSRIEHGEEEDVDDDGTICVPGSKLIRAGFKKASITDDIVMFVNAGGESLTDGSLEFRADRFYQGGDELRTDETITNCGDCPPIYQSARIGNFLYRFDNIPPGHYLIDLHFVEIINTNGPKGLRVFDVFMQEEKVLSRLDIFSIVGSNKPLQLVGVRIFVGKEESIVIRFEGGVHGSPTVSGICIRHAPDLSESHVSRERVTCSNCAVDIEISIPQDKVTRMKCIANYEMKIEQLSMQCQLKTAECHEAWMSLATANEQLENIRMELDNKFFQILSLDEVKNKQAAKLDDVLKRYGRDKKCWAAAILDLQDKIKVMKQEHFQLSHEAHECASSVPDLNNMLSAVQALVAQYDDLKLKYVEEQAMRKNLYNQVQEAKGNIRVFCRCRPFSKAEESNGSARIVDFDAAKDGDLVIQTGGSAKKTFKFDRVYSPKDDQADVFEDASPMVISVLDGYNVCIFAYGQTGTGKTFTMEGTERNRGVNYRTLEQLFKVSEERKESFTYNISVSVLEVYNEQIRDLLATSPSSKKLEIRQSSEGVHHVPGIVEAKVERTKEVWDVLQAGSNARAVGSNNVNEHSSRSHCLLCIMIKAKNLANGECTYSKLWLVDLAGSERLAKTDVQGERLKEAQNINKSLSALGDVISALASKSSHIPYRNSKLTHLLQDSLGGNSKTLMFVQISPAEENLGETLSSLNFASRVRGVELGPAKKQTDMVELQKFKNMLDKLKQESRSKDDALKKLEDNFQNIESKAKAKDQICRNHQDKISELECHLESKAELCRQLEKQLVQVKEGAKGREEICSALQQKVKELENKLKTRDNVDSTSLQLKVNELENQLKERTQDFELYSYNLQQKVKELENKLKMEEDDKAKLRQMVATQQPVCVSETPYSPIKLSGDTETWSRAEAMICDIDSQDFRPLKSCNRNLSHDSVLLKGTDSLREIRRKRESTQSKGNENFYPSSSTSILEKKVISHVDPSKPVTTRTTRSSKSFIGIKRPLPNSKVNREQASGVKDRDIRTRLWHG